MHSASQLADIVGMVDEDGDGDGGEGNENRVEGPKRDALRKGSATRSSLVVDPRLHGDHAQGARPLGLTCLLKFAGYIQQLSVFCKTAP